MSPKDWEQEIKEAYCNYRWRKIMEPLCDVFQKWKAGEIAHEEVDKAIDEAYKEKITVNSLMAQRQDRAAGLIRYWDPDWFQAWVEEHQAPIQVDTELS